MKIYKEYVILGVALLGALVIGTIYLTAPEDHRPTVDSLRLMVQLMRFQANVTFRDHEPKAVEDTRIKDSLVNLLSLIQDSNPELLQEAMNSLQATN